METPGIPLDRRPDLNDMASAEYDNVSDTPADKTLIICAAPRTGSSEFCRYLMAAGIGIPHEYFNRNFADGLGRRLGIGGNPLSRWNVRLYIDALRKNRGQNGVLAINLQYWQLNDSLINQSGDSLFSNATVVHLFRPDIGKQLTSWRVAVNTGVWDYSDRKSKSTRPFPDNPKARMKQYAEDLKFIVGEDTGFREFFALTGIDPFFITMKELFRDPADAVHRVAKMLEVPVNNEALKAMIERSKPYPRDEAAHQRATEGLAAPLRKRAFGLR